MGYANFWPGANGAVFYIDYEHWKGFTDTEIENCIEQIVEEYVARVPSFRDSSGWHDNETRILAENNLFYLCWADNHWSDAIALIAKGDYPGLEQKHIGSCKKKLQEVLLQHFPEIGVYGGSYTHGTVS